MADLPGELLLLVPTTSYRLEDFRVAARRLGVPLVVGSDRCHRIEDYFGEEKDLLSLDYRRPDHEGNAQAARRGAEVLEPVARRRYQEQQLAGKVCHGGVLCAGRGADASRLRCGRNASQHS